MRSYLSMVALLLIWAASARAQGILIPSDSSIPPLARVGHRVNVVIEDQVAETRVEQVFRNPTDRPLEATYVFPVPKNASVHKFAMWVDGKKTVGELVDADKAREIYTDIVRRSKDPGLLEYMGNNLFKVRVFPVPANGEQKIALSFTSMTIQDAGAIEYPYPLRVDKNDSASAANFALTATIKSSRPIQNVYSPTHRISLNRSGERQVTVGCESNAGDKDFQLFYSLSDKDVNLTTLTHRPISGEDGYFLMLLSPRLEAAKKHVIPRDLVLVLDTSGSMLGPKMNQARKAVQHCLNNLNPHDRFALIGFATTVEKYREQLVQASAEQLDQARKWVDRREASGSTAIHEALLAALSLRGNDADRPFTVVFFTDGLPTVGESDPNKILQDVVARNSANTRIFTFGVGDDVDAVLLDQLAEKTRAVSSYVRPAEDIEAKVSSFYAKISHPVLTDLKLQALSFCYTDSSVSANVQIKEIYPPRLPDLFHGGQLIVLGRYTGADHAVVTLTGSVGKQTKQFHFETEFPKKTGDKKGFVEQLWARRKVGYLLDQVRANGSKKELVDEVVALAKKYSIVTPYTSYLVAPDGQTPVAGQATPATSGGITTYRGIYDTDGAINHPPAMTSLAASAPALQTASPAMIPLGAASAPTAGSFSAAMPAISGDGGMGGGGEEAEEDEVRSNVAHATPQSPRTGQAGVEYSLQTQQLRDQEQVGQTSSKRIAGRSFVERKGVWIDEGFSKQTCVAIKTLSPAYFRLLERYPELKEVFQLGNRIVVMAPSGKAVKLDPDQGAEQLSDMEIIVLWSDMPKFQYFGFFH